MNVQQYSLSVKSICKNHIYAHCLNLRDNCFPCNRLVICTGCILTYVNKPGGSLQYRVAILLHWRGPDSLDDDPLRLANLTTLSMELALHQYRSISAAFA